jgi:hypothetical protein
MEGPCQNFFSQAFHLKRVEFSWSLVETPSHLVTIFRALQRPTLFMNFWWKINMSLYVRLKARRESLCLSAINVKSILHNRFTRFNNVAAQHVKKATLKHQQPIQVNCHWTPLACHQTFSSFVKCCIVFERFCRK